MYIYICGIFTFVYFQEKTEPTLDSVIDELDKLWEEEISPMDDAAAVFLLKLL